MLPSSISLDDPDLLEQIILNYELTGSQIANIITFTAIQTTEKQNNSIHTDDILDGIRLEYQKEDKVFSSIKPD